FMPSSEMWPGASINARIPPICVGADEETGKPIHVGNEVAETHDALGLLRTIATAFVATALAGLVVAFLRALVVLHCANSRSMRAASRSAIRSMMRSSSR